MVSDSYIEKYFIGGDHSEKWQNYRTAKFFELFGNIPNIYPADDNVYLLMMQQSDITEDGVEHEYIATAAVKFSFKPNSYVDMDKNKKNMIYIDWLSTANEQRGVGALSLMCKLIIETAENAGVFLYGYSKPFKIEFPKLNSNDSISSWIANLETGSLTTSFKKEKENSAKLLKAYLRHGFCRYDGAGTMLEPRYWRSMCFGYKSSQMPDNEVSKFIDLHLKC